MKTLNKISVIVGIISVAISIFLAVWNDFLKSENKDLENNLRRVEVEYTNEKGQHVTEVTELRVSKKELENILQKKDNQLNDFEKKLKAVTIEMQSQQTKMRNIESAGIISSENRLQDAILLIDTVYKDHPVKHAEIITPLENISFQFDPKTDSLKYDFSIRNDIYFSIIRKCKIKDNGKDHFPKWGSIWGWDYFLQTKAIDTNTVIKDAVLIKVNSFSR